MKTKKIKRLLRRAAKRNGFEIDEITGKRKDDVYLFAENSSGSPVLIGAERNEKGKVLAVGYLNSGVNVNDRSDDVFVNVDVKNFKKFINNIDVVFGFDYLVTPQNIETIAEAIDSVPGLAPGSFSTYIQIGDGLGDGQVYTYA